MRYEGFLGVRNFGVKDLGVTFWAVGLFFGLIRTSRHYYTLGGVPGLHSRGEVLTRIQDNDAMTINNFSFLCKQDVIP